MSCLGTEDGVCLAWVPRMAYVLPGYRGWCMSCLGTEGGVCLAWVPKMVYVFVEQTEHKQKETLMLMLIFQDVFSLSSSTTAKRLPIANGLSFTFRL